MAANGLQILGISLSILGWVCTFLSCYLPMWKVTAFIENNIVVSEVFWEGLWMICVFHSTGQMQCKIYDSLLALSEDLQTARALCTISIAISFFAFLISIVGAKCTKCVEDEGIKAKIMIFAGVLYMLAGIMVLIPVCWSAHVIIQDFYNPLVPTPLKRELGASLYIGWAAAGLLIFGGAILCCFCPPKEDHYPVKYNAARAMSATHSSHAFHNYV
ncbi:claudin-4-like [Protopterus annectens]|uniref:claudin-4-like n=1 Tax=Protopterus annectens TaxID=7888 RepID=UPI001CFB6789|nr:claudin-4-like [Protopterus annectens]